MTTRTWALALLLASRCFWLFAEEPPAELTYEKDIRPILKQHCFHCHGEEPNPHGQLDLRTVKVMLRGGDSGPAIIPGEADSSLIWRRVAADEMPEGEKKVPPQQKAILRKWIEQGARTARPEPDDPNDARFTEEELNHWAWKPPVKAPLPEVGEEAASPIDRFLLAKLREKGIEHFSPSADRRTLIRRATFDLTGLPPTPEEVEAFIQDDSPDAYEQLLDRLLLSPHYGERWARHWLDVAGYAETDGAAMSETTRPHAWRYRDYVIASFNANKRYDVFLREQLAGDELVPRPYQLSDSQTLEKLAATGFLRMAPDATQTANSLVDRNEAVAEMLKVVSSATLGLTIGCAQCHDHKYDPITTEDYYRYRAIFDPAFDLQDWKQPSQRLIDITPQDVIETVQKIEAEVKAMEEKLGQEKDEAAKVVFDREVGRLPEEDRAPAIAAINKPEKDRTPEEKALLDKYPNVKPTSFIRGFFVEYDRELHAKFTAAEAEIAKVRGTIPPRRYLMIAQDGALHTVSKVHFRGDPSQPTREVHPGEITVLSRGHGPIFPADAAEKEGTTGRRRAYAEWLTSGEHPLTARVFVNRVWSHHFGRGLVSSPGDFGLNGDPPTHPELLDWLAVDFVENGWNVARLHRQIMTSAAYRQSSARTPELDAIDPDNRLLGRMNIRRLEAESVRDAILAASGRLHRSIGGPSVPVVEDGEGMVVFGKRLQRDGLFAGVEEVKEDAFRRSIYVEQRRSLPLAILETFDLPKMTPNCDARRSSTVAPQALLLLNDAFVLDEAGVMADRLRAAAGSTAEQVKLAYETLFARPPTEAEQTACESFLAEQQAYFQTNGDPKWLERTAQDPAAAPQRALACLCQTLICSNRFLYVD